MLQTLKILQILALLIEAAELVTQRGQLLVDVAQIVDLLIDGGQIVVVAGRL